MARPKTRPEAAQELCVVDGRTHLAVTSPALLDDRGNPLPYAYAEVGLWASQQADRPIHPTLAGGAPAIGGGRFSRAFLARDLARHLGPHAGHLIWLRWAALPERVVWVPVRVVWQLSALRPA